MRHAGGQQGSTLLELVVALSVLVGLMAAVGSAVTTQANLVGHASDELRTLVPAEGCLQRIRNELKSAVRGSPGYAISSTSVAFRPLVGYLPPTSPSYSSRKSAGLISSNDIEYAPYLKTISYSSVNRRLTLSATGTLPAGMKASEVLCEDVATFSLLNGDNTAASPPAADAGTVVVRIDLVVSRAEATPGAKGVTVTSNVAGRPLSTRARLFAELLVNSNRGAITGP